MIKFQVGMAMNYYDVNLTDHRILLTPSQAVVTKGIQRFKAKTVPGVKNSLSLWFYPENTVVLNVPGAQKGDNVEAAVYDLAKQRQLKPLTALYPEFVPSYKASATYYFVAKNPAFLNGPAFTENAAFGHIEADTKVFGLDSDEPGTKSLAVFARTPRSYE